MELLAFVHSVAAYDDPTPPPKMRSLTALIPSSAWMGLASLLVVSSVLTLAPNALALVQLGDNGASVEAVQQALADAGFNPGGIDGIFGQQTDAAVREFQRSNRLETDGIVGSRTAVALGLGASDVASSGNAATSSRATGDRTTVNPSPSATPSVTPSATPSNASSDRSTPTTATAPNTASRPVLVNGARPSGMRSATVTAASGVRVRANPGLDAEVIDSYGNGQALSLTGEQVTQDGYTWVRLAGTPGWVAQEFLSSASSTVASRPTGTSSPASVAGTAASAGTAGTTETPGNPTAARPSTATIAADALIVRDGPNGTDTGNTLFRGERVSLTGQQVSRGGRDWMQLSDGGWVAAEYVSMNSQS